MRDKIIIAVIVMAIGAIAALVWKIPAMAQSIDDLRDSVTALIGLHLK